MIINKDYTLCDNINNIKLRVIDYGHATSGSEWVGNIVTPPYARLYYIIDGDPYIMDGQKKLPLSRGGCYLMPTGYSFRHACDSRMEQLYFHLNLLDYSGADLFRSCRGLMEYTPGSEKINELIEYTSRDDLIGGLMLRQELYTSILTLFDKYSVELESVRYSRCVLLAIEYIKSHLSLQLGIAELAANAFVSESTLTSTLASRFDCVSVSHVVGGVPVILAGDLQNQRRRAAAGDSAATMPAVAPLGGAGDGDPADRGGAEAR